MIHRPLALLALTALGLLPGCAGSGRPASPDLSPAGSALRELLPPEALPSTPPASLAPGASSDHRVGPNDLLDIAVFEAPELDRTVRVSGQGYVSLPLLGEIPAAGRTSRELEVAIQERLRAEYVLDPHVSVQVSEIQSRSVSVVGAVNRPGIYQVTGTGRTLLDVLALAGGLSEEAGESVLVVRAPLPEAGPGAPATQEIALRELLESGEPRHNVAVLPGDVVTVKRSGLIYVVGEVERPGAFPIDPSAGVTLLQAIALGQGFRPTAARGRVVIIRGAALRERTDLTFDFGDVVSGRIPDPVLRPKDVVFVPNSAVKSFAYSLVDALVRMVTLRGLF